MNTNNELDIPKAETAPLSLADVFNSLKYKRARRKSRLPLRSQILSATGFQYELDEVPDFARSRYSDQSKYPMATVRQMLEADIESRPERWLPGDIVCERFLCSPATLYRWSRANVIKSVLLRGQGNSRPLRRFWVDGISTGILALAKASPRSKWAAVAASVPSVVEARRARRRREREAARRKAAEEWFAQHPLVECDPIGEQIDERIAANESIEVVPIA